MTSLVLAAIAAPMLAGLGALRLASRTAPGPLSIGRLEQAAFAWLLGYGWIGFATSTALVAGAPLSLAILWPLAVLPALGLFVKGRFEPPAPSPPVHRGVVGLLAVLVVGAGLMIVGRLAVEAWTVPIASHDEFAIWALKATSFHLNGGLDTSLFTSDRDASLHPDYPIGHPAFGAWLLAHADAADERMLKLPSPILWLVTLILIAGAGGRYVGRTVAALFALGVGLVDALHVQGTQAMADLSLGAFALAAWCLLERGGGRRSTAAPLIAALCLGFALNTKNEALALVPAAALVAWVGNGGPLTGRVRSSALMLVVPVMLAVPWLCFKHAQGLYSDLLHGAFVFGDPTAGGPPAGLGRLPLLARTTASEAFGWPWDGFWWLAALALVVAAVRRTRLGPPARFANACLALVGGFWFALCISPHDPVWHATTALPRLLVQIAPCAAVAILAVAGSLRSASPEHRTSTTMPAETPR